MLKGPSHKIVWPDHNLGKNYGSTIFDVFGQGVKSVETYYDNLAEDYDEACKSWGWCLPDATVETFLKYADLDSKNTDEVEIVDLGCGNGMIGEKLVKRYGRQPGKITGLDISQKSLDVAERRGCYETLRQTDLLKKLPFPSNTFDYLICTGTTAYLGKKTVTF